MTDAQPAPLPDMPPVQYADVNGVRMAFYEVGPRGEGTPIVFCHGFPELAFSWRHQLKAMAAAGRWAIAPDQRGYGLTTGPEAVEAYDLAHLTGDLIGLLDHVGAEKAIWCGHDWGGIIVWQMPLMHAERTAAVIGLNTPFMRPRAGRSHRHHASAPGRGNVHRPLPEARRGGRHPRPRRPQDHGLLHARADGGQRAFAGQRGERARRRRRRHGDQARGGARLPSSLLVRIVEAYDPAWDRRPKFLTDAEFDVFAENFARTGFTGGINWYRNFTRNWERSADLPQQLDVPCLMVMAGKRCGAATVIRGRNGAVHSRSGEGSDRRVWPLDAAGAPGGGEPDAPRLAGKALSEKLIRLRSHGDADGRRNARDDVNP